MSTVFLAIMPIFILLLLGYIALKTDFIQASTWIQIEKATYFALFPCLLIHQLANAQINWSSAGYLIGFAVLIPALGSVLAFIAQRFCSMKEQVLPRIIRGRFGLILILV